MEIPLYPDAIKERETMLNIVIPMAGAGSRFAQAGFSLPKPLIPIYSMPMIQVVIHNLRPKQPHRFIFICQRAHEMQYALQTQLRQWTDQAEIVLVDELTEGAACTVLMAESWINRDEPLVIANSDQFIECAIDDYLSYGATNTLDGLIMTMTANDPKWSFAAIDQSGMVTEVAEKKVISNHATVGIYYFARGSTFVAMAKKMIANNERVNNEFYVAPVYNQLIAAGGRVGIYDVGSEGRGMHGLGTPQDLSLFLTTPIAQQLSASCV